MQNASANATATKLVNQCNSITHILRRVTNRKIGLEQHEIKKGYEALLITRYSLPYPNITKIGLNLIKTTTYKTE